MAKYLIIIEKTHTGFSAYCPDLPGCAAIAFHLDGLRAAGLPVPQPECEGLAVEVAPA